MDFSLSPELSALRAEVRRFVDEEIIPKENLIIEEDRAHGQQTLRALQEAAERAGLFVPHLPREFGGRGLGPMGMAALFREMGRSLVGARVFNCDAPDQGNMELLLQAGSQEVKERYLLPLCRGTITSAFCMTEPAPGAGADPQNLRTAAKKQGDEYIIDGHKWFSTGGHRAAFLIVMARTSEDPKTGATLFVVDRQTAGIEHLRDIPTMADDLLCHREAELVFRDVRVPASAVLGGVGSGFELAQRRLVPARLTHCMRWLGLADRALDLCREYILVRSSFGAKLAEHQLVQQMIAEGAAGIHAGNLLTYHCAWLLESGQFREARPYSSIAKNHVAQTLLLVLDNAIQMHGARGYSRDLPFSDWYRHARAARIADGPDEVHTQVIARDFLARRLAPLI